MNGKDLLSLLWRQGTARAQATIRHWQHARDHAWYSVHISFSASSLEAALDLAAAACADGKVQIFAHTVEPLDLIVVSGRAYICVERVPDSWGIRQPTPDTSAEQLQGALAHMEGGEQ